MTTATNHASAAVKHYGNRAASYDTANTGPWHVELGLKYAKWLSPKPGSVVLDLACGTGLVTIPLAEAVGPTGQVIAVDITPQMLDEARKKELKKGCARIEWVEHDIMDLTSMPQLEEMMSKGGFDVISCCSALVLLPDAKSAINFWAKLLKPGGRIITDVPTEEKTLLRIMTQDLRDAAGLPTDFDWRWVQGSHSLEELMRHAGLKVEKSWREAKYTDDTVYQREDVDRVFDEQLQRYKDFMKGDVKGAKEVFKKLWEENLQSDGTFRDGSRLYIVIGRKPEQ